MPAAVDVRSQLLRPDGAPAAIPAGHVPVSTTAAPELARDTAAVPAWKRKMMERSAGGTPLASPSMSTPTPVPVPVPAAAAAPGEERATAPASLLPVLPPAPQALPQLVPAPRSQAGHGPVVSGSSAVPQAQAQAGASLPTPAPFLDLNKLQASLLRAQMLGDSAAVARVQAQIEAAQQQGSVAALSTSTGHKRLRAHEGEGEGQEEEGGHVVLVSALDARGMPIPSLARGSEAVPLAREDLRLGRKKGKVTSTGNVIAKDEESGLYGRTELAYGDASTVGMSMAEIARQERTVGSGDLDNNLFKNIVKGGGKYAAALSSGALGADEEDSGALDDAGRLVAGADARLTALEQRKRDMARAVQAQGKSDAILSKCPYCVGSPDFQARHAHRVIAQGEYCYLALPPEGPRVPGHLILVPREHTPAMTAAGEEAYSELNRWKAALCGMYRARQPEEEDALFLETATGLQGPGGVGGSVGGAAGLGQAVSRRHARIDVVPMEREQALDAALYYRKAIQDHIGHGEAVRGEWATNKGIVDTAGKGLRKCVPPGFAYFHVSWQGGGLVHPIDEEGSFPALFGLDIAAGMTGADPARFGRKEARAGRSREVEEEEVRQVQQEFEAFDFTRTG